MLWRQRGAGGGRCGLNLLQLERLVAPSLCDLRRLVARHCRNQGFDHDNHVLRQRDANPQLVLSVASTLTTQRRQRAARAVDGVNTRMNMRAVDSDEW